MVSFITGKWFAAQMRIVLQQTNKRGKRREKKIRKKKHRKRKKQKQN